MELNAPETAEVRVLVVEDDRPTRECLCRLLESFGYSCSSAADGLEALRCVRTWMPEAIVMDVNMPRLDGLEATRRLRADPATRAIPIVVLSANANPDDERQALTVGVNVFLTKPTNLSDLLGQLRLLAPSPLAR